MMAGERKDSQIGQALAPGPPVTDIMGGVVFVNSSLDRLQKREESWSSGNLGTSSLTLESLPVSPVLEGWGWGWGEEMKDAEGLPAVGES